MKREGGKITVLKCTTQNVKFDRRNVPLEENGFLFESSSTWFTEKKQNVAHTVYLWLYDSLNRGDYFPVQHQLIGFCKQDIVYLDEFQVLEG